MAADHSSWHFRLASGSRSTDAAARSARAAAAAVAAMKLVYVPLVSARLPPLAPSKVCLVRQIRARDNGRASRRENLIEPGLSRPNGLRGEEERIESSAPCHHHCCHWRPFRIASASNQTEPSASAIIIEMPISPACNGLQAHFE